MRTAKHRTGGGKLEDSRPGDPTAESLRTAPCWPQALRPVRGWLQPWYVLTRCWQAWSDLPPPPEVQALLNWVADGRPINLYLRI